MTLQQHTAYMLMTRIGDPAHFHGATRLFQEWLVDKYGCIEAQRLHWVSNNQGQLWTDTYRGLADAVEWGDHNNGSIGRRTILPSSFTGGPRHMKEQYQDAMALTAKFGKPDAFITMICNPYWKEIQEALGTHQHARDRPDLCARIFHLKKKALLADLTKHMTFGKVIAHLHVIEFQKRGVPHAHLMIFLANEDKPRTPEQIDLMVCAQLPGEDADPDLFKAVTRHMLHGPCGRGYNEKCVCIDLVLKACKKHYPKNFQESTNVGDDSYPTYARPQNGRTVQRRHPTAGPDETILLDNQWVVPYNPYLLLKYDCHINVEICNSIRTVRYMHNYVYKGPDRANARFHRVDGAAPGAAGVAQAQDRNEVQEYLDGRYISSSKAAYRTLELSMHNMYPSVQRLQLHLDGDERVIFHNGQEQRAVEQGAKPTTLTACLYLMHNIRLTEPQQPHLALKYPDVVDHYRWDAPNYQWVLRTNNSNTIGRLYGVHPVAGKSLFLRILLNKVPGPTCFDYLKTYSDVVHPTFRDACVARGLLESAKEWIKCLEEADVYQMPQAFCGLFATLLVDCQLTGASILWERYILDFCGDFSTNVDSTWATHTLSSATKTATEPFGTSNASLPAATTP